MWGAAGKSMESGGSLKALGLTALLFFPVAVFSENLPQEKIEMEVEKIPWGDKRYAAGVWQLLLDAQSNLELHWDRYSAREQRWHLERAEKKSGSHQKMQKDRVWKRFGEITSLCGILLNTEKGNEIESLQSCDLTPVMQIRDDEIEEIARWVGPKNAAFVAKKKLAAMTFLNHLQTRALTKSDVGWAFSHLPKRQAQEIMRLQLSRDHQKPQKKELTANVEKFFDVRKKIEWFRAGI